MAHYDSCRSKYCPECGQNFGNHANSCPLADTSEQKLPEEKENNKKNILYKFHWDCGRMGEVEGLFIADPIEVHAAIGKEVYLGEVLGKHSDVYGTLDEEDLTVLSEDQEFVAKLEEVLGTKNISGYNPLLYIEEEE